MAKVKTCAEDVLLEDETSMAQRYRLLSHLVDEKRPELVNPDNTELLSLVKEANLMPHVDQTPTERLLDARLFRSLTGCGDVKARRLSIGSTPKTPLDVVLAIREKYQNEQPRVSLEGDDWVPLPDASSVTLDWARMGEDMAFLLNQAAGLKCMKGFAGSAARKRRAPVIRQKREKPTDSIQEPERHAARELDASATDTERKVNKIWSVLQGEEGPEGIPLAQLTLNPDSYPQTVVNVFNVMFLVKDQKVALKARAGGEWTVKAVQQRNARSSAEEKKQAVICLTHQLWEKWCRQVPRELCRLMQNDAEAVVEEVKNQDEAGRVGGGADEPVTSGKKSSRSRYSSNSGSGKRLRRK